MEPEKNLHASVPPTLLSRVQEVAQKEQISLDEWLRDAMESRLDRQELDDVLAFGKRHATARGLKPDDIANGNEAEGLAAVARIRELRKGNILPEGVTIRDLINEGRA